MAGFLAKLGSGTRSAVLISAGGARQSRSSIFRDEGGNVLEFDLEDLVTAAAASFRLHPRINNILTHISSGQWGRIARALCAILNPLTTRKDLSSLVQNIVVLSSAERGGTGQVLKLCCRPLLAKILPPHLSAYLIRRVFRLFLEIEAGYALASIELGSRRIAEG